MDDLTIPTGKVFGHITVQGRSEVRQHQETARKRNVTYWECKCVCGKVWMVSKRDLLKMNSCGCKRPSPNVRHRLSSTPEYACYMGMKNRCLNPNNKNFDDYGGRGIAIAPEWLNSFNAFYKDMGQKPTPQHSIERRNNDGPYAPWNCRWATRQEQGANTRKVHLAREVTFNNQTHTLKSWAALLSIKLSTLKYRLDRWPIEKALAQPLRKNRRANAV